MLKTFVSIFLSAKTFEKPLSDYTDYSETAMYLKLQTDVFEKSLSKSHQLEKIFPHFLYFYLVSLEKPALQTQKHKNSIRKNIIPRFF